MNLLSMLLLPFVAADALSASSLSIPPPTSSIGTSRYPIIDTPSIDMVANPWRVTLDIGREPLANMPFDWARSGCRMPIVIPCDFQSDQKVIPQSETVSFTGPTGAVVSALQGGKWEVNNSKDLTFQLTFPEYMERRDVWIDAGTILTLQGTIYTKDELDRLDQEFYQAREEAWEIGGELNEIAKQIEGPKKWNEEKQVWEKRTDGVPSIFSQIQKRVKMMGAQNKQKQKASQRPRLKDLSEAGSIPGINSNVYIQKQGLIKIGNVVAGRWYAEPIDK